MKKEITSALYGAMLTESWTQSIRYPNQANFDTPKNEAWLKVTTLFATDDMYSLNDTDTIPLIFQVDIFAPKDSGNNETLDIVDKLERLFSKRLRFDFTGGFMRTDSFLTRPVQDDTYHRTTCEINLTAYVERV